MFNLKTEYRWLLFILIPFFFLLAIHITIPLVFLFESQPLAVSSYTNQNIQNLMTSLRSFVIIQTEQMSSLLRTYTSFLNLMSSTLNKNNTFSKMNPSQIELNNAFEYYHSTNSLNNTEPVSMWFASGVTSYDELTDEQKKYFENFQNLQPMLRYNYQRTEFKGVVQGIYISYNVPDNEISFHFPSYRQNSFSSLNQTIMTQPYESYLQNYHQKNQIILIKHFGSSHFTRDTMSFCTSISNSSIIGVICIDLNMEFFMEDLTQAIFILQKQTIRSSAFLLKLTNHWEEPSIIAEGTIQNSILSISYPSNQTFSYIQTSQDDVWNRLCQPTHTLAQQFTTFKQNGTQIYIMPICINQGQTGWSPVMFSALKVHSNDLITKLNNSQEDYQYFRKVLIITSIIAIIFSLIASICIIKMLLKRLDVQLYKLHKACKFIAKGDINIKIPEYKGTKDIALVYDEIKTINKLFIYSENQYFSGHYSNKVLKYVEAIELFTKINYNPSFLFENLGSVYMLEQEFTKAIYYYKLSVDLLQQEIQEKYGTFDSIVSKKKNQIKLPKTYHEIQVIFIRRLWKLNYAYINYLDYLKTNNGQSHRKYNGNREQYILSMIKYIALFKKAVYPNNEIYAETILFFLNQARFHVNEKNLAKAKDCWEKAENYCHKYTKHFDKITEKLKKKGSRNKIFFKKNRLSRHSRTHPHILQAFCQYVEALILLSSKQGKQYYPAICVLTEALKKAAISQTINYYIITQIRTILIELGINPQTFQSTQIFRETLPEKTLNYEEITPRIEKQFYKYTRNFKEQKFKQYVLMYDTGKIIGSSKYIETFSNYFIQQTQYIFQKFILNKDRISITKFNSSIQMETICNLTFKQYNEPLLKKYFQDIVNSYEHYMGKNWLIQSLAKILWRIKNLQSQKVVIIFLRPLLSYTKEVIKKVKKDKEKSSYPNLENKISKQQNNYTSLDEISSFSFVGDSIVELFSKNQHLRNCKIIFMCSKFDQCQEVIIKLGLKNINKRIWSLTQGINKNNNVVFLSCQRHQNNLERIMASKIAHYIDNHVFIY